MKLIGFLHFLFLALLLGMTNAEAFHYDAAGRLVAVVYPNDSAVTYAYDPGGNLQTGQCAPYRTFRRRAFNRTSTCPAVVWNERLAAMCQFVSSELMSIERHESYGSLNLHQRPVGTWRSLEVAANPRRVAESSE